MLRALLIFITMSVVYCQTDCPGYSAFSIYPNNGAQPLLVGTFTVIYTSSSVVDCQRMKYSIDANNVTKAVLQTPNCCFMRTIVAFNSDKIDYTAGPIPGHAEWCPGVPPTSSGSLKIVAQIGTGDNLCLVYATCQPNNTGLSVMCRGIVPTLIAVVSNLINLLASLGSLGIADILAMKSIKQLGCAVDESNECFDLS